MTKIVIHVGDDFEPATYQPRPKSIPRMFLEGLRSIIFPPVKPRRFVARWYKSVETGRWVKVWVPESR